MAEEKFPQFAEDDDVARAKAFWNDNGKSIIFGIVLGLGGIVGFNSWQSYEQRQGEQASELYEEIIITADSQSRLSILTQLQSDHQTSHYASLAVFTVAKQLVEENNLDEAISQLNWVLEQALDGALKHVARIRLSTLYLAQSRAEDVLELVNGIEYSSYESRYLELSGDAYAMRNQEGDVAKARDAYESSLDVLPTSSDHSALIRLKLDNLSAS